MPDFLESALEECADDKHYLKDEDNHDLKKAKINMKLFNKISGTASQNISDLMLNFIDHTEEAFTWSKRVQLQKSLSAKAMKKLKKLFKCYFY